VELLVSILIIGALMGLLIVGLRQATRVARGGAESQNVSSMKIAAAHFGSEFGFAPPLVRDQCPTGALQAWTEKIAAGQETDRRKIAVYDVGDPINGDTYRKFLQRETAPAFPARWGAVDPALKLPRWWDPRYSEGSLAIYLTGGCPDELLQGSSRKVPIDLVGGPGFLQPNLDGTFASRKVRNALLSTAADTRRRQSKSFQPFFSAGTRSASLTVNAQDPAQVRILDRNGKAYRYYFWLPDDAQQTGIPEADRLYEFLNTPWLLGDPNERTDLRDAEFAIVAAGPDGAFGDEPIEDLGRQIGVSVTAFSTSPEQLKARQQAAADNIVAVGRVQ
jgi:type II secretory pathway pseudopilin PulG